MFVTVALALLPGVNMLLPGAVVAFVLLQRGPRIGAIVALGAAVLIAGLGLMSPEARLPQVLVFPGTVLGPSLVLAAVLARSQSLSLCLQVGALLAIAAILVLHASFGDPAIFSQPLVDAFGKSFEKYMADHDVQHTADFDALLNTVRVLGSRLWGWTAAQGYLLGLCAVFLARKWQAGQEQPGAFGAEFRSLRLGLALGVVAAIFIALSIWLDNTIVDEIAIVFLAALLLIGLAAAHRFRTKARLHVIWLWVMYIGLLLVLPLMVALLATWGFVDNWLRSSRPAAPA
jgi:hypothetical protein